MAVGIALLAAHGAWLFFDVSRAEADYLVHYRWAAAFVTQLQDGVLVPVWVPGSRGGLGDPALLYYPPVFFYLTAAVAGLVGDLWVAMKLVCTAAAGAAALAIMGFARQFNLPVAIGRAAGVLSIGFAVMVVMRHYLTAYPWFVGTAVMLCAFLALIHFLGQPTARRAGWLALATAVLCLTHTLSAAMFLWLVGLALGADWLLRDRSRAGFATALGAIAALWLGMAAAAFSLLPSVTELDLITPSGWRHVDPRYFTWWNTFAPPTFTETARALHNYVIPLPVLLLVPGLILAVWHAPHRDRRLYVMLWIVGLALLLASDLSYPIWAALEPLQTFLQRPYRFIAPAGLALILAGLLALAARPDWSARLRWTVLGFTALALAPLALFNADYLSDVRAGWVGLGVPTPEVLDNEVYGQPEHLPITTGPHWESWLEDGGWTAECARQGAVCSPGQQDGTRRGVSFSWQVSLETQTSLRLPLFDFPAWHISLNGTALPQEIDPETGLLVITPGPGRHDVVVQWHPLASQRLGAQISLGAVLVILGLLALGNRPGTRTRRDSVM